jgi:nitric oxide synthase-interacting protein
MGRHSKDCGDLFTYAERKENANGSVRLRLGKDSVRAFDQCSMGLVQPRMPVVCPAGYLFDKEAILACLLEQKQAIKADATARKRQLQKEQQEQAAADAACAAQDARAFVAREDSVVASSSAPVPSAVLQADPSLPPRRSIPLSSHFWLPPTSENATPDHAEPSASDPTPPAPRRPRCPLSKRPMRLKDLRAVHFHAAEPSPTGGRARYVCPVCAAALSNAARPAVLASGHVLCGRCVDKAVRAHGRDPVEDCAAEMGDVIFLQAGGTAFAASGGGEKEAVLYKPSAR